MTIARTIATGLVGASGAVWVVIWIRWSLLPVPAQGELRPGGETFDLLNVLASGLLAVGLVVLLVGTSGPWGAAARLLLAIGVLTLSTGHFTFYPLFILGALLLLAGSVAFAVAGWRNGWLPAWSLAGVLVGVVSVCVMDSNTIRAWFGVPVGVSWLGIAGGVAIRFATLEPTDNVPPDP